MSKRTEITIEQHEITILRSGQHQLLPAVPQRAWCPVCAQEVIVLTAETAAQVAGVSRREIYRRIERSEMHFNEIADGLVQVCLNSLQAALAKTEAHGNAECLNQHNHQETR